MSIYRVWCVDLVTGDETAGWLSRRNDFNRKLTQLFGQVFHTHGHGMAAPVANPRYGAFDSVEIRWVDCASFQAGAIQPWEVVVFMVPNNTLSVAVEHEVQLRAQGRQFPSSTEPSSLLGLTCPTPPSNSAADISMAFSIPCCCEVHVLRSFENPDPRSMIEGRMSGEFCARVAMHEIMHNKVRCEIHSIANNQHGISAPDLSHSTNLLASEVALLRRDLGLNRQQVTTGCALFRSAQRNAAINRF